MIVISLTVGLLPLKVRKLIIKFPKSESRSQIFLSASLCFGAGVLLGTIFLHLLPETLENVETARADGFIPDGHFPIAEIILCSGFFFMYILEELVHLWVHSNQEDADDHLVRHHHHHHSHSSQSSHHIHDDHEHPLSRSMNESQKKIKSPTMRRTAEDNPSPQTPPSPCRSQRHRCESLPTVAVLVGCDNPVICADPHTSCTNSNEEKVDTLQITESIHQDPIVLNKPFELKESTKTFRSILVIMALSIHGCLEGLSLGLEDEKNDVWLLFAALSAHKIAIAFSIGMELLEKQISIRSYVMYMIIFSLASPLGGLIGALVKEYSSSDTAAGVLSVLILQGMSGGTILFVVFCEVLERERSKTNGRLARLFALFLGFIVMACLEIFNHQHHHGNTSNNSTLLLPMEMMSKGIVYSISNEM